MQLVLHAYSSLDYEISPPITCYSLVGVFRMWM